MDASNPLLAASRARWAVAAMFLVNGFITGSWAPQIPVVLTRLSISETTLGLLILGFGLGALVAMPLCGMLMARSGSRAALRVTAILACFGLLLVALAETVWTAALAMTLFGALIGSMDVAMNTNAVAVERRLGRAIMSSSHGFWSVGGFFGGGLGGIFIQTYGYLPHAIAVTVVALILIALSLPSVLGDPVAAPLAKTDRRFAFPSSPAIYLVGIVALFSMIPEGAVLDWAAIYLRQELGADLAVAGFAFAAFSGAMATMRFLGDRVRNRFGAVKTMRLSSLIAAAGMIVAGLSPSPWLAICAFAFCGLGIANMVPIAFSAAGNQPGLSSGAGMSVVTTMGYSGILLAPSGIGFFGERTGFSPVFMTLSGLLVIVCLLANLVRSADFEH